MPTAIDHANYLDSFGWNVLPAPLKDRQPSIKWRQYQTKRTSEMLKVWFQGKTQRNYVLVTGRVSNLLVLDTDSDGAHANWEAEIGAEMAATTCVQTGKGKHYYFTLPDDDRRYPGRQHHEGADQWDIRGDGSILVAPPSVHESGRVYSWIRGPESIQPAPQFLLNVSLGGSFDAGSGEVLVPDQGVVRSMLSHLLAHPGEGGRNNWVTQVLGHYAKANRRMQDLYQAEALRVWQMIEHVAADDGSAYERFEFDKTVVSVWEAEMRKGVPEADAKKVDGDCGWLVGSDRRLMTQVRYKDDDNEWVYGWEEWADFDIQALGVVEDSDAQRVYDVEVYRARQGDKRRGLLPSSKLNDGKALTAWLGEFGVGVMPPAGIFPQVGTIPERLRRYLESQNPPSFEVVDSLGWYDGSQGFVCHEGVIRPDGLHGFEMHKPHPRLSQGWAPYRYGFEGTWEQAQEVLREVLTFHDETVCSVFGSWWAACFLKPQIQEATSQFPFMALEAPSESGKTTGFFGMLLSLGGNTLGNTNPTMAALRDYMSGNQSGIFWIDDLNEVDHLLELLRQATGDGAVSKKAEDKTSQAQIRLVNPICLSGEALPVRSQKALVDRAVMLDVGSPTSRRSLRNPELLQWADIVALRTAHKDLTVFSGWYVAAALALRDRVGMLASLVPPGAAGRWGDKMAVLRLGARLLAEMTGDQAHIARVDAWAANENDSGSENTLTLKVIPQVLARTNFPNSPMPGDGQRLLTTPVFVENDNIVWFSPQWLATWVYKDQNGRIEQRTETVDALTQQARALGLGGSLGGARKQFRLGSGNTKSVYWRLTDQLSSLVIERARGGRIEQPQQRLLEPLGPSTLHGSQSAPSAHEAPRGVHPEQHKQAMLDLPMGPRASDEGV